MFEHRHHPLASHTIFKKRLLHFILIALGLLLFSLVVGMLGYMYLEHLNAIDAFLNATMLLGGMGPINTPVTIAGKIFAGCYALYSGIVFLLSAGLLFTPIYHRFLHHFHLELEESNNDGEKNV